MRQALAALIDYAGLFPPAGLDMQRAAENYASYRDGEYSWVLGSFVVPAARLEELEKYVPSRQRPWNVSVLTGPDLQEELGMIGRFVQRGAGDVAWIETKAANVEQIRLVRERVPRHIGIYFEIADPSLLGTIAESGSRAKLRTGGVTAEAFPSVDKVARFIRAAREEKVPFKCTAGLHHAVRAAHPLTYQPDSPRAVMHGFLNVLLAAALAQKGASVEELAETLEASSLALPRSDLEMRLARECGLVSFGSCSFTEPIADLRSLEIL